MGVAYDHSAWQKTLEQPRAPDVNRDDEPALNVPLQRSRNSRRYATRTIRVRVLSQQGARKSTMGRKGVVHGVQCV